MRRPEHRPFGFRFISPLLLGTLLNPVNSAMIATALVPIGRDLRAGPASTAWLVAGLYLAAAVGQPTMGRVADMYGPRKVAVTGLVLVLAAGLAGTLAPGLGALVFARVLLGLGTSAAYPVAMTMIRARAEAARIITPGTVLGLVAITGQVSATVGPALGGLLVAAIVVLCFARRRPSADRPAASSMPWVVANALTGPVLGVTCYQWALRTTAAGVVQPIVATAPLLTIPFAVWIESAAPPRASYYLGALLAIIGATGIVLAP